MPKSITRTAYLLLPLLCVLPFFLFGQEEAKDSMLTALPLNLYALLSKKSADAEERLDKTTGKYLTKLLRQETKLRNKLAKVDSMKARGLFAGLEEKYSALKRAPQRLSRYSQVYSGHLDSLTTSLNLLQATGLSGTELTNTLSQFASLQEKLNQTEAVKHFLNERKRLLKEDLARLGMLKELKGFSKQAYYYAARLKEVKTMWQDPTKLEKKLLEHIMKTDEFKDFFRCHSQFASLFALPGGNASAASLQGLQTRANVQQTITTRLGSGADVQQRLHQNLQAAQEQLQELKEKPLQYGTGSFGSGAGSIDMPEGFTPNTQKHKTFLQRLEYGANVQSQKARSYLPVTSDVGLSLGYKLNDKSAIGIGASYKVGWGKGWSHLHMTSEGVGVRSYVDYKLKGSLYISGGYEQNYRTAFYTVQQLKEYPAWQTSGLLGLSKKYKISKKVKGDMKLLWDFLSHQQMPRTQAVLFRIGYSLR